MENYLDQIRNIASESQTNKIFVLGKGPTAGKVMPRILKEGIVININDSERIFPGHFCLFHSLWAYESIKANNFKANLYFSSRQIPERTKGFQLPYEPETFDIPERTISNLNDGHLTITDFLFISAIKLSLKIAECLNKMMVVYFIGFDFYTTSKRVIEDYSQHLPEYTEIVLKSQESIFQNLKLYLKGNDKITIQHVGNRTFSDISVELFNRTERLREKHDSLKSNNSIYKKLLSEAKDGMPFIVAELTNNHIGDEQRLRTMIRLVKEAGADAIKVQKRDVNTFYTEKELNSYYFSPFGTTFSKYRSAVELSDKLFDIIIEECASNDLFWFTSILDLNSYYYMQKFDLPLLKLPSTISNHRNFMKTIGSSYLKDLVISTGFSDANYEDFVLNNFTKHRNLFLLQCTSSYPTPPEACQISVIRHYSELRNSKYPDLFPGYSSHDLGSLASMMAVSAGALMIEKHVKLGTLDWVHFDGVALDLTTNEFKQFVQDIKRAYIISGNKTKVIHPVEDHKYLPNSKNN